MSRTRLRGWPRPVAALATALAVAATLAACGADDDPDGDRDSGPEEASQTPSATATSTPTPPAGKGDYAMARSETREDSVYPEVGDPIVDALHYGLDLTWDPEQDELTAVQTLTFRATADSDTIPLDFNDVLEISSVTVDGLDVDSSVSGKDLTIAHPVTADQQYVLTLAYAGTPEPTPAPSERSDFKQGLGWNITDDHATWTLQEPRGAYTWYAANDQPADKAFYDFTLRAPESWEGVANGVLTSDTTSGSGSDGTRTMAWHLAEPAATYLVTVAFGDFQHTDLKSSSGVPLQVWTDADGKALPGETAYLPKAVDWVEKVLGPYPFDSLGILVVDNESGMETQTMITLGDTAYSLSGGTIVHEVVHQWYGDTVTPADWSDVWMNEGMAMYLQGMWEAEQEGIPIEQKMDDWAEFEDDLRESAGPPGNFDPEKFGDSNIYYGPALMWHELREKLGDDTFFKLLREWPASQENGTADRDEYLAWIEKTTGQELTDFFDGWLLDKETPDRS